MTKKATNLVIVISVLVVLIIGVVVAVVLTNNSKEYTYEVDNFLFKRKGDRVTLTKFANKDAKTSVTIPLSVDGFAVTDIGEGAFEGDEHITEIVLTSNIKTIGARAFKNAIKLSSVRMEGVTAIGDEAFMGAKTLTYVNMPESLVSIGARAFKDCSALSTFSYRFDDTFKVKSSLASIGEEAFAGSVLKTAVIPSSMTEIGARAFTRAALNKVIFYEGVKSIGDEAFYNNANSIGIYTFDDTKDVSNMDKNLESLHEACTYNKFPLSLERIGKASFKKDDSTYGRLSMSRVEFSDRLMSIGDEAFMGADINYVTFASPDTTLGKYSFSKLYSTIDITLPEKIVEIPEGLCYGTTISWNKEIVVPASATKLGIGAFAGGKNQFKIKFAEGSPLADQYEFRAVNGFQGLLSKDGKVLYSLAMSSSSTVFDIPESVEVIERYAMSGIGANIAEDNLSGVHITIPKNVREIRADAFKNAKINSYYLEHDAGDSIVIDKDAFGSEDTGKRYIVRVKKNSSLFTVLEDVFGAVKWVDINTY